MHIWDLKTPALIFALGKMVITGAKSGSMHASYKNSAFDAKFFKFKIQNIIGSCDVKFLIR